MTADEIAQNNPLKRQMAAVATERNAAITAQAAVIVSLRFDLAETEALEMQHGAVIERQAAEIAALKDVLSKIMDKKS